MNLNVDVSVGCVVFLRYALYKRHCARECAVPVTYAAWLWVQGLSNVRPW
jgi:hypothetical protein